MKTYREIYPSLIYMPGALYYVALAIMNGRPRNQVAKTQGLDGDEARMVKVRA